MIMKRVLLPVIVMTALCLHGATMEDARRIVRETMEFVCSANKTPSSREQREGLMQARLNMATLERNDVLSAGCEILADKVGDLDPEQMRFIIGLFRSVDGDHVFQGNPKALDWARSVLREKEKDKEYYYAKQSADWYLRLKGDARDLNLVLPYGRGMLEKRVQGINLVNHITPPVDPSTLGWYSFCPSVTNTGPQGVYVEAILRHYWERLDEKAKSTIHPENLEAVKGMANPHSQTGKLMPECVELVFPPQLLRIVVSFDMDGNPVSSVDLMKYGLFMPVITPQPTSANSSKTEYKIVFPHEVTPGQ